MAIKSKIVNVKDFGAKGDGSVSQGSSTVTGTDDSAAFKAAINYIWTTKRTAFSDGGQAVDYTLYIPSGIYIITQPESLVPSTYTTPSTTGLRIVGDGRFASFIHYKPATAGTYLINDNNAFMFIRIADISFTSTGEAEGVLNHSFMHAYSAGQAQNYIFERCNWQGGWKYLWHFNGGQNSTNSECTWYNCDVGGSVETGFYIPPFNGTDSTISGSDQNVNYNFFACHFVVGKGNFFRLDQGGSLNIWGGNWINSSVGVGDGTTNNTFFKLGLAATTANQGAFRLSCQGVRFEMRGSSNNKLIECNWPHGLVSFINCTMDMNSWNNQNIPFHIYDFGSNCGPDISYSNCSFMGKVQIKYNGNHYQQPSSVNFDNCALWSNTLADEFVILTNTNGVNTGGASPIVKLTNCTSMGKGASQYKYITDGQVGWHNTNRGQVVERIIKISGQDGSMPRSAEEIYLPLNSLILSAHAFFPSGSNTSASTSWQFTVKTSETTPTTLATHTTTGAASAGMNSLVQVNPPFFADTDVKRHLVFNCNASVDQNAKGYWLLRYIG